MRKTSVTCAVIVKNGMVLAANRGKAVSNTGMWEFPGGKPQESENFEQCLVRRVNEELGLNIRVREKLRSFDVTDSLGRTFEMHPYLTEVKDGQAALVSHSRAEWFMPIQLMQLAWPQTDLPIIDEIVSRVMVKGRL